MIDFDAFVKFTCSGRTRPHGERVIAEMVSSPGLPISPLVGERKGRPIAAVDQARTPVTVHGKPATMNTYTYILECKKCAPHVRTALNQRSLTEVFLGLQAAGRFDQSNVCTVDLATAEQFLKLARKRVAPEELAGVARMIFAAG